jgi:hypothetical protein
MTRMMMKRRRRIRLGMDLGKERRERREERRERWKRD